MRTDRSNLINHETFPYRPDSANFAAGPLISSGEFQNSVISVKFSKLNTYSTARLISQINNLRVSRKTLFRVRFLVNQSIQKINYLKTYKEFFRLRRCLIQKLQVRIVFELMPYAIPFSRSLFRRVRGYS